MKARAHHRCCRLHQRPGDGDESQPNWLVCEAGEAGCVPAVSSRRLTSFSFIILVTTPPRPRTRPPAPGVWPEKRKRPRTMDPGVIGTTDEENFFFCLFVFASLLLTLSPLLANPLTTWQRVSTKKCKSFSSSFFCYFPPGESRSAGCSRKWSQVLEGMQPPLHKLSARPPGLQSRSLCSAAHF